MGVKLPQHVFQMTIGDRRYSFSLYANTREEAALELRKDLEKLIFQLQVKERAGRVD